MSKFRHGLVLACACLAGLATAAPAASHTLGLGAAKVTRAAAQAPIAVNAPVRVLSPGGDDGRASSGTRANGSHGSVQAPVAVNAPVRVLSPGGNDGRASSGTRANDGSHGSVQAPIAVNAPVRVLSPGRNGRGASSQTQAQNRSGASVLAPIAINAPVRVLSPGDDEAGATGPGTDGGGSGGAQPSTPGVPGNVPVVVDVPIRILSPGDDGASDRGVLSAEAGSNAESGHGVREGNAEGDNAVAETAEEVGCRAPQALGFAGSPGTSLFGARSLVLLALLALGLAVFRTAGSNPLGKWLR